jgi:hypothetical protein
VFEIAAGKRNVYFRIYKWGDWGITR